MKNKKILWLVLLSVILCFSIFAIGCEEGAETDAESGTEKDAGPLTYTVKLTDYAGNVPDASILIEMFKGESSVGMKKLSKEGTATFELESGDYTFVPKASSGEYHYDKDACSFSAEKTVAEVVLYAKASVRSTIYPPMEGENQPYDAAVIGEGATFIEMDRPEMTYCLFAPERGGIYRVGLIGGENIAIGCYGESNVVLDHKTVKTENNTFEIEVLNSSIGSGMGGTLKLVIGLESNDAEDAIVYVERIGDPKPIMPWTILEPMEIRDDFVRSDHLNHKLADISVTDKNVKVVKGNDGYYHYGDTNGPVVFIRISSASKYLQSFTEICEAANLCRFFYDDAGNLIRKEGYNLLIAEYEKVSDNNGVVPLTDELINAVKNSGEHMGWWYFNENGTNIFSYDADGVATGVDESNIVKENAWMFACCYNEKFAYGSSDAPIKLTPSDTNSFRALIPTDGTLYLTSQSESKFTLKNAAGLTVSYNGEDYTADETGVLTLTVEKGTSFTIKGEASAEIEFDFKLVVSE